LSIEDLVLLLKYPTCLGASRRIVLRELARRTGPPVPREELLVTAVASLSPGPLSSAAVVSWCDERYPQGHRRITDFWEMAEWLRDHHPELDLAAPLPRDRARRHESAAP
jgi:hypothetical protein